LLFEKIECLNGGKGIPLVSKAGNVSTKAHKYSYNYEDLDYKSTRSLEAIKYP
jgi:hypothetical protein